MRYFIFLLSILSLSAFASDYQCFPKNSEGRRVLREQPGLEFKNGALQVSAYDCSSSRDLRYPMVCSLGDNTLMISTTGAPSLFVTRTNRVIKLSCKGDSIPQQQEEQEEQDDEHDGPGHGGGTIVQRPQ